MKINKKSVHGTRRKLYIFREWCNQGVLTPEDIFASYQSWRAHARRCNSFETLSSMDKFFVKLFKEELRVRKRRFPCTLDAKKTPLGWEYFSKRKNKKEVV